jgi:hypothetical protein
MTTSSRAILFPAALAPAALASVAIAVGVALIPSWAFAWSPQDAASPEGSPDTVCAVLRVDGSWADAALSSEGQLATRTGAPALTGTLAVLGPDGRALLVDRQRRPSFRAVSGQAEMVLADGQRMPGSLAGAFTDPDGAMRVVWKHLGLGAVDVALDKVAGFSLQGGTPIPQAQAADVLQLSNGDVVEGVVERIGESFVVEKDGQRREIPVDRIAACGFVTSPATRMPVRVWQADGTVIDGTELRPVGGMAFALAAPGLLPGRSLVVLSAEEMHGALVGARSAERVVPLATLVPRVERSSDVVLATRAPSRPEPMDANAPLGIAALEVRGPVRLVYEVPKGSERLVGQLSLLERLRPWAHAPVKVMQGTRELLGATLDAERSVVGLDIALDPDLAGPDADVTIEIGEGQRGAIGDVIVIDRGFIIVR